METIFYKVLWVDDQNLDPHHNPTSFFEGYQLMAEEYNIELVPFDNWEEAEESLNKNFDEYSAIILDANCKIHKSGLEDEAFITAVLPSLTTIFGEKRKAKPWYLLSAGTMNNFENIVSAARYQHSKNEDWGELLYLKDNANESGESVKHNLNSLFSNIERIAKMQSRIRILSRHNDVFQLIGTDKLIGIDAKEILIRILTALYYPQECKGFDHKLYYNQTRQLIEKLFRGCHKVGLLPDECIENDIVNIWESYNFLSGKGMKNKPIRFGDNGETVLPPFIDKQLQQIIFLTNEFSHSSKEYGTEKEHTNMREFIEKNNISGTLFALTLIIMDLIVWLDSYRKKHSYDENRSKIKHITSNLSAELEVLKEEHEGKTFLIEKDEDGDFHCGKCLISDKLYAHIEKKTYATVFDIVENTNPKSKTKYPLYGKFKPEVDTK